MCCCCVSAEPQDPDGMMAAVADFGLSRALAFGQVRDGKCGGNPGFPWVGALGLLVWLTSVIF